MSEWEFSAEIDGNDDLCLEWYKSKGNVVTVCFSAIDQQINWAALIDNVAHHGCTVQPTPAQTFDEHGK